MSVGEVAGDGRRRWLRVGLQLFGFAVGLSLLGWVVVRAAEELDSAKREQLASAPWWQVGLLVVLSVLSVGLNGVAWWSAVLPARKVRFSSVMATNAGATALALLPFKLSILFRVVSHRRRDGLPVLVIGGWMGALAAMMVGALGPAVVATVVVGEVNVLWWVLSVGGAGVCGCLIVVVARFVVSDAGRRLMAGVAGRLFGVRGRGFLEGEHFGRLREGAVMLGDVRTVWVGIGLRLLDAFGVAGRFWLASRIAGEPIDAAASVIAGTGFFVIGAVAPTGAVGVREAGTAGLFAVMGVEQMAAAILLVSAVEAGVVLLLGLGGGAYVWPGLVRGRGGVPS